MNLSVTVLQSIMPKAPADWLAAMIEELPKWGIDTPNEVASFIAQIAHESNELTRLVENLNYSATRMSQVWKRFAMNPDDPLDKRQPNWLAFKLERNPQALANFIYDDANRGPKSKLGNVQIGDGWRFHGRGPIQLTGRDAYTQCGHDIGEDLVNNPGLLLTPFTGIRSACWFWKTRDLDAVDDDDDVRLDTRRINGGETGLVHRQAYMDKALPLLRAVA